jgi:hypothetical protein
VAVPVEVRALDAGPRLDRVWRLTRSIGEDGLVFESRELPFEPGRPVRVSFVLPDDDAAVELSGVVQGVPDEVGGPRTALPGGGAARARSRPVDDDPEREGERATWRAVSFVAPDVQVRRRIQRYVQERMILP